MEKKQRTLRSAVSLKMQLFTILALILALIFAAVAGTLHLAGKYALQEQNDINRTEYMRISNALAVKNGTIQSLINTISYLHSMREFIMVSIDGRQLWQYGYSGDKDEDAFLNILCAYSYLDEGIENVIVVNTKEDKTYVYQYYQEQDTFRRMIQTASDRFGYSDWEFMSGKRLFTISAPIYKQSIGATSVKRAEQEGSCIFFMDIDALEEEIGLHSNENVLFMIVSEEGKILSEAEHIDPQLRQMASELARKESGEQTYHAMVNGQEYVVYANTPEGMNWRIIGFAPVVLMSGVIEHTGIPIITVWCVVALLIILLVGLMFSSLYGFITRLTSHMERIKDGEWNQHMARSSQKEFIAIGEGFDSMMARISELSQQNMDIQKKLLEQEIDKRQMRLLALQSQINPHFLYNTLECVKSIGVFYGVEEVSVISESLAYMFRYSIKGKSIVQIEDELTCVRSYMAIQHVRYGGRFSLDIQSDEGVGQEHMPKMLLQPLVENALIHGLERRTQAGRVCIRLAYDTGNTMLVSVSDDGVGMTQEQLAAQREMLARPVGRKQQSNSIGLMNVRERLTLYYGDHANLEIDSEQGKGTCVRMRIPLEVENQNVSSHDRG